MGRDESTGNGTALTGELRTLTSLRSRSAVRDRVFPALDELLGDDVSADRELRFAALQDRLDGAIAEMTDPAHRVAAAELLGSGPNRWQPLTRRGPRAANAFQLGWDAYRRRRETTGASLLDETLDALAATLVHGGGATDDVRSTPPPVADEAADRRRSDVRDRPGDVRPRRHIARIAAAVAAVVVIAGVAAMAVASAGSDDGGAAVTEPRSCGRLSASPGDVVTEAGEDVRKWSAPFREAAATDPDIVCAGPIQARDATVFQQVSWGSDDSVGILLAPTDPDAEVIILNALEFRQFRASAWETVFPTQRLGLPLRREPTRADGARVVSFENGAIVQASGHDVAFAVTDVFHEVWIDHGGPDGDLGLPFSNRYEHTEVGSTLDFAEGRVVVDYFGNDPVVTWYGETDHVPPQGIRGNILRAPSGQTWFVDDQGKRRWLPTDDDVACVRDSRSASVIDVATAVIVDLPTEPLLRCL